MVSFGRRSGFDYSSVGQEKKYFGKEELKTEVIFSQLALGGSKLECRLNVKAVGRLFGGKIAPG